MSVPLVLKFRYEQITLEVLFLDSVFLSCADGSHPAALGTFVRCLSIDRQRSNFYSSHGVTCGEYSCKLDCCRLHALVQSLFEVVLHDFLKSRSRRTFEILIVCFLLLFLSKRRTFEIVISFSLVPMFLFQFLYKSELDLYLQFISVQIRTRPVPTVQAPEFLSFAITCHNSQEGVVMIASEG